MSDLKKIWMKCRNQGGAQPRLRGSECEGPKVRKCLTCGLAALVQDRATHGAEEQRRRDRSPWGLVDVVSAAVGLFSRVTETSFWFTAQTPWETAKVSHTLWSNKKFRGNPGMGKFWGITLGISVCELLSLQLWGGSGSSYWKKGI